VSERLSRSIAFGGAQIHVKAVGTRAVQIVSLVFRHAEEPRNSVVAPLFEVEEDAEGIWTVGSGNLKYYTGPDEGDAALALQDAATETLARGSRDGLMFHAAAVALDNVAVMLPGKTGAGKTTLTAHLLRRGFSYLTDEMSYLPLGDSRVSGLPRPLGLKVSGRGIVETEGWEVLAGSSTTLVLPPSARPSTHPPGLVAIVFPQFVAGTRPTVVRLSAAATGMRLMGTLLNARNLDGHGFAETTALALRTPGFELTFGSAVDAADEVSAILASLGGAAERQT